MRTMAFTKKGTEPLLVLRNAEPPKPASGEVLVKVKAVSLNAADYRSIQMGMVPKSRIFGADVAGTVVALGANVSDFTVGDDVVADLASHGFGGLADYVAAPSSAWVLKPAGLSFQHASAVPLAGITALQGLQKLGRIASGTKVLIVGSAGSVGPWAVQLAKFFGSTVTGVCSTANVEQTRQLGADFVIDYTREDYLTGDKRYDLILAVNGNNPIRAYKRCLNSGGRLVVVGGALTQIFKTLMLGWAYSFGSKKVKILTAKQNRSDLVFLLNLVADGTIKPVIDKVYPLEQASEAMQYLSAGHAKGKVVVNVD